MRATFGSAVADKFDTGIWGIDEEGEIKSAYKETGVKNFWLMVGFLVSPFTFRLEGVLSNALLYSQWLDIIASYCRCG